HLLSDSIDPVTRWVVAAISNPDNAQKLSDVIRSEIDLLLEDGVTEDEVKTAKQGYLESRQIARTDDNALVQLLRSTLHAGRTMEYYAEFEDQVRSLTPDQINESLRKHLDPEKRITILAGDFERQRD